ncbi:hypothetical protein A3D05_01000 [Candidatus Gottesmanbacteria bacterium RIFCSPHIGHO2_02_FULL_40_24]|uniref:methionyl-tRNA formyltransferase n=1 Tax=Candidatus Gottesmanbacteria bacterium RIFCSPHIGHO2_01_FULL_40_15 TaxID=1798376 RepID=A0A1F5YZZ8_9BACT|nr:MAG: hypothetical protein A2777_00345 [Candidatus Gottesmanbacteria bacterium RIFCSPHIGHO2_01_FULL_40_15]OGG17054.1 MAG: hypothetical protein A3D05_01000 [Candidatus Gottesmanbacteria bacterium RIFCSPHIGHO2_02_FULL_40_24]OGG21308.1 MAG: hypothetical protein A3B48_04765 [Candidatus Gottesmanbacteria bacterium RIFCSPLOWO2_01_FULL_40_10]OGG23426.1 MAG: hypothetical protein A3E42_00065 [Candidatus Gottesmanbacteria bacterium RIFCSPHIGHO2_12_FULL_40_13]OGG33025.1 MAG: hypothetical protein A3I80_0
MNVVFFGSSDYCLPVLRALDKNFDLKAVVAKKSLQSASLSPVIRLAVNNNIPAYTPSDKNELESLKDRLNKISPHLFVVSDYGYIIPDSIFTLPKYKTINIHFSRLPRFRGPSPVQYSILSGVKKSFITVILMTGKVDTGNIIFQKQYPVNPSTETTGTLYAKLFLLLSKDLPAIINGYIRGKLTPIPQLGRQSSETRLLIREDGLLPFRLFIAACRGTTKKGFNSPDFPPESLFLKTLNKTGNLIITIERAVRAFDPWPGVWTVIPQTLEILKNKRLKILKVSIEKNKIIPRIVQLEGKKPVNWKQFIEGYPHFLKVISNSG